ncbi:MAG: RDD family protein [Pseudomonadota bacterium]
MHDYEEEITQQADDDLMKSDDFSFDPEESERELKPIGKKKRSKRDIFHTAPLVNRIAAISIDLIVVYLIYWTVAFIYRAIVFGNGSVPIPVLGLHSIILHSIFILITFIYFLIFEFTLTATIGKMLSSIRIRTKDGRLPSFSSILLRNIFKPVDLILFPLLITGLMFEKMALRQRLGDLVSKTVVVKPQRERQKIAVPNEHLLASATSRSLAFLIDLTIAAVGIFGLILLISANKPTMNQIIIVLLPVILFSIFFLPEMVFGCSFGKFLFGIRICNEDGSSVAPASAVIRTIMRLVDTNPFGYISMLTSLRKQRPGDAAAGTIVIKHKRSFVPLIGNLALVIILLAMLSFGFQNSDNILEEGIPKNLFPKFSSSGLNQWRSQEQRSMRLFIPKLKFVSSSGSDVEREPIYDPGEEIYFIFELINFNIKDGRTWLKEDIDIVYPSEDNLKLENFLEVKERANPKIPLKVENSIQLNSKSPPGRYGITVTLRDMIKGDSTQKIGYFYVTSTDSNTSSINNNTPAPGGSPVQNQPVERDAPQLKSEPIMPSNPKVPVLNRFQGNN